MTVRDLLLHTSGLIDPELDESKRKSENLSEPRCVSRTMSSSMPWTSGMLLTP